MLGCSLESSWAVSGVRELLICVVPSLSCVSTREITWCPSVCKKYINDVRSLEVFSSNLITVPKRSCGKVMFSQMSVILWGTGVGVPLWPLSVMHWDMGTPPRSDMVPTPPNYWHLVVTSGDLFKLVHLRAYPHIGYQRWQCTSYWNAVLLPTATSCGQGNIFTPVCHSVHGGRGCLPQCMLGYHTP